MINKFQTSVKRSRIASWGPVQTDRLYSGVCVMWVVAKMGCAKNIKRKTTKKTTTSGRKRANKQASWINRHLNELFISSWSCWPFASGPISPSLCVCACLFVCVKLVEFAFPRHHPPTTGQAMIGCGGGREKRKLLPPFPKSSSRQLQAARTRLISGFIYTQFKGVWSCCGWALSVRNLKERILLFLPA